MKRHLLFVSILTLASPLALAQAVPDPTPPADPAIPATPAAPADPAVPAQKDDQDGTRSPEVKQPRASGSAGARSSGTAGDFAAFDANGDGKLSRDEARADAGFNFSEMDRDKDGSVSRGEYESGARASTRDGKSKDRRR